LTSVFSLVLVFLQIQTAVGFYVKFYIANYWRLLSVNHQIDNIAFIKRPDIIVVISSTEDRRFERRAKAAHTEKRQWIFVQLETIRSLRLRRHLFSG